MKHLVVSVAGGPLAFIYGTQKSSPVKFISEIKIVFGKSKSDSIEFICVDPNTNEPYTKDLDPHEAGFKKPDYKGEGWNAKIYNIDLEGKAIAGMHQYCGSGATNLNDGKWQKDTQEKYVNEALSVIRNNFPSLKVKLKTYKKSLRKGKVDIRLQSLTKTKYFEGLKMDIKKEIQQIKSRNRKVELDKAWETSITRKIIIAVLTYSVIVIFFIFAGLPKPFINSIVPAVAFMLSTMSMNLFKKQWIKNN